MSAVFSADFTCSLQLVVALNAVASLNLNGLETPAKENSDMTTRTAKKHWSDALVKARACGEAIAWAKTRTSARAAWKACERADWMLWIAGRFCTTEARRKQIILVACACARTALKFVPKGERRPLIAIETTERWARGDATIEDVRRARNDCWDFRASAASYAANASSYAAYAAAYAAAAASAASYASAAAYAASAAAAASAANAARSKALVEMANIVRNELSMPRPAHDVKKVRRAA